MVKAVFIPNTNHPPVIIPLGGKTINEGELLRFFVDASDPDNDPLSYSAANLPPGAAFGGRTFSWQPGFDQAGTFEVTFTVSDGRGGTDSGTMIIHVNDDSQNRPPVFDPIGNKTTRPGEALSFSVTASDPDGDQLTYSGSGIPQGATFDSSTRVFAWTPTAAQVGSYQMQFQVTDGELNQSELVAIEVIAIVGAPQLPDPFPYGRVAPSQGTLGVNPGQVCFGWPAAANADTYDFMLSRDPGFSPADIVSQGLTDPVYCIGTATTSLTPRGIDEPKFRIMPGNASRNQERLSSGQSYYWKVTARNIYGEVGYPVFDFFTRMAEGAIIGAPQPLVPLQYQMISIPLSPENPNPLAVLGDKLGPYNPSVWRLFRFESTQSQNREYPDLPDMNPGAAYWLIIKEGVTINVQGGSVDTESDFVIQIPPGFFQLGFPFLFPVEWTEVKVRNADVTVLIGDPGNQWMSQVIWKYENGDYTLADVLEPWKGYWIQNVSQETVDLLIPPKMFIPQQ